MRMYLFCSLCFTRMPGENYSKRSISFLLSVCVTFFERWLTLCVSGSVFILVTNRSRRKAKFMPQTHWDLRKAFDAKIQGWNKAHMGFPERIPVVTV